MISEAEQIVEWLEAPDTFVDPVRDGRGCWVGWNAGWRNARSYTAKTKIAAIKLAIKGGP